MGSVGDLDPSDREQVGEVVDLARSVFGEAAIAVYLFGSAVRGRLRPSSDLDLLLALDGATTRKDRRRLIDGLLARSRSAEAPDRRHLELSAVVLADIRPWRYPPALELQYGDWWRSPFMAGEEPWTSPNPDLAVILTSVRDDGLALVGPPADELLDPVPRADLARACRDVIPELLPGLEDDDTRNSLLTLARIWFTLSTGRIESKDVAAAWALERLPTGAGEALSLARAAYAGEAVDHWDAPAIEHARADWVTMTAAIDRL